MTRTGSSTSAGSATRTGPGANEPSDSRRPRIDWGRYGRRPVALLAAVAFIDSVDRGILPGVLELVQDDLGFSDTRAGVLGSVFVLMGFLATLPAGYLADRHRRTAIIAVVLTSWGAISAVNAAVRNYWQFLGVRAALGIGETIDNPASQSLIADYYRPEVRGRAYALQRVAPTVGTAVGLGVGGAVGSLLGWRAAFLVVGVPGSLLALAVWRMHEPDRGESDTGNGAEAADPSSAPLRERGARAMWVDVKRAASVPTLRALMIGSAIAQGALAGLGFWAAAFYDRHTSLSSGQAAGLVGGLILIGAVVGTLWGGRMTDRMRDRVAGGPMLFASVCQATSAVLLAATFLPVPLWFRIPGQTVAVLLVVAGLPALTAMIAEVVPATIRGISFSVTGFLGAVAGAISPLLIGVIADQFEFMVDGKMKGHLANAFLAVTPLIVVGAFVVFRGRRHVESDRVAALAELGA